MSRRAVVTPAADADLDGHFLFIARDKLDPAVRFLHAARQAFQSLADRPGMGPRRDFDNPALGEIRSWPIRGFKNYLIFYRPIENGVEIIRVLHGAQDLDRLFGADAPR